MDVVYSYIGGEDGVCALGTAPVSWLPPQVVHRGGTCLRKSSAAASPFTSGPTVSAVAILMILDCALRHAIYVWRKGETPPGLSICGMVFSWLGGPAQKTRGRCHDSENNCFFFYRSYLLVPILQSILILHFHHISRCENTATN